MNDSSSIRSKPWYANADPSPSQTEGQWTNFGNSLNAISFGFVATAILISMFLIMAIFEHLLRPKLSYLSREDTDARSLELGTMRSRMHALEKLGTSQTVSKPYSSDLSVMMPGHNCPTFIAQPAPLPCPREGICWPSYNHNLHNFGYP